MMVLLAFAEGEAAAPAAQGSDFVPYTILGLLAALVVAIIVPALFSLRKNESMPVESSEEGHAEFAKLKKDEAGTKGKTGGGGKGHKAAPRIAHVHHPLDLNTLKGHGDVVTGIAFTADGLGLATACADRVVRVFRLEDVASKSFKFLRINLPTGVCPTDVAFGAGASQLAIAIHDTNGGGLCLYGASDGKAADEARQQGKLPPPEMKWDHTKIHKGQEILNLVGAPTTYGSGTGGVLLATCSEGTDVKLWFAADGKCVATVDSNQLKNTMAALSPDGRFLAVAAFTADVKIWEVRYEKDGRVREVAKVMQLKGHKSAVTWLDFCWDAQKMVTASKDGTLKIWNINVRYHLDEDPRCLHTFQIPDPPGGEAGKRGKGPPRLDRLSVAPDDGLLAAAVGSSIQWLSLETGELLATAEHAHESDITCLAWAPKKLSTEHGAKMVLATGGLDKKVKLWEEPARK